MTCLFPSQDLQSVLSWSRRKPNVQLTRQWWMRVRSYGSGGSKPRANSGQRTDRQVPNDLAWQGTSHRHGAVMAGFAVRRIQALGTTRGQGRRCHAGRCTGCHSWSDRCRSLDRGRVQRSTNSDLTAVTGFTMCRVQWARRCSVLCCR